MNEKIPTQGNIYFSAEELDTLNSLSAEDEKALAGLLVSKLEELGRSLTEEKTPHTDNLDNLCIVATSSLDRILKGNNFNSSILEGNLEIGPQNWLIHRVNLVKLSNIWVLLDLTSKQLPWFKDKSWLVQILPPNEEGLKKFLKREYHWWIPGVN